MAGMLRRAGSAMMDLLFPPRCVFCDSLIFSGQICQSCRENLLPESHQRRMAAGPQGKTIWCFSSWLYDGAVRESILRFKFYGRKSNAEAYGLVLAELLRGLPQDVPLFDLVTPVPISAKRLKSRGYNQSMLVADAIARSLSLPCKALLEKHSHNLQQHLLPAEQRRENVKDVYRPAKGADCTGKTVLLIDDIVTTGATLCECASVLLFMGAKDVVCCAIADCPATGGSTAKITKV